ncbi:hypothetical protein BC827DRAFT_1156362 [Russula dissimulans]|nr:hypothetical protein BC827DRAFT_1156362 [Russula dissimulans]
MGHQLKTQRCMKNLPRSRFKEPQEIRTATTITSGGGDRFLFRIRARLHLSQVPSGLRVVTIPTRRRAQESKRERRAGPKTFNEDSRSRGDDVMDHLDLQDMSVAAGPRTPLGRSHDDEEDSHIDKKAGRTSRPRGGRTKSPDDESMGLWEEETSSGDPAPKTSEDERRSVCGLLGTSGRDHLEGMRLPLRRALSGLGLPRSWIGGSVKSGLA